jgi:hypothetical protein
MVMIARPLEAMVEMKRPPTAWRYNKSASSCSLNLSEVISDSLGVIPPQNCAVKLEQAFFANRLDFVSGTTPNRNQPV